MVWMCTCFKGLNNTKYVMRFIVPPSLTCPEITISDPDIGCFNLRPKSMCNFSTSHFILFKCLISVFLMFLFISEIDKSLSTFDVDVQRSLLLCHFAVFAAPSYSALWLKKAMRLYILYVYSPFSFSILGMSWRGKYVAFCTTKARTARVFFCMNPAISLPVTLSLVCFPVHIDPTPVK